VRPDPVAHGLESKPELWDTADATYEGEKGKGQWVTQKQLPPEWAIELDDVKMIVRLAPYKHTGVFPEQESNWRWMRDRAHGRAAPGGMCPTAPSACYGRNRVTGTTNLASAPV
jgi:hypothetical protein